MTKSLENPAPTKAAEYQRRSRAKKRAAEAKKRAEREAREAHAEKIVDPSVGVHTALAWITENLRVPSGPLAGEPFHLPNWQRDWIIAASGDDIREAGLSVSRKNGKSGLIAAWLLAHLVGPLARTDWRCIVASMTGTLARELREAIELTALVSGFRHEIELFKSPPPGRLVGKHKSRVDFLAADRASGHAVGADLAIIDEAGLLPERQRFLWNSIFSSVSGRDGRLWCISIQGDGPMFAEMAARKGTPGLHFRKWTSAVTCPLDDEDAWHKSNPGLASGIKSIEYMRHQAARAIGSPGNEAHFRAFDLNQPIDPERETIVSVGDYVQCIDADAPEPAGDLIVGLDLGGSMSMTAAAVLALDTGAMVFRGAFGDEPTLEQRARTDRMGTLYDRMRRAGELKTYPGRVTPVVEFIAELWEWLTARGNVIALGLDRHRKAEAQQAFRDAGVTPYKIHWRGQGASRFADGSHDVRAFQRLVRTRRLRTRGSVMLESAIANSVLRYDVAGNPALDKAGDKARIDALSAAVIAAGLAELAQGKQGMRVTLI